MSSSKKATYTIMSASKLAAANPHLFQAQGAIKEKSDLPMLDQRRRDLVFVVDDEPNIAVTAALILCSDGFDARAFTDPLAALKAAQIEAPNLVLSDVIMPGLNGYELIAGVVRDCPRCKVLLFSGNPGARDNCATTPTEKSLEILPKPILPVDLRNAVRRKLQA